MCITQGLLKPDNVGSVTLQTDCCLVKVENVNAAISSARELGYKAIQMLESCPCVENWLKGIMIARHLSCLNSLYNTQEFCCETNASVCHASKASDSADLLSIANNFPLPKTRNLLDAALGEASSGAYPIDKLAVWLYSYRGCFLFDRPSLFWSQIGQTCSCDELMVAPAYADREQHLLVHE